MSPLNSLGMNGISLRRLLRRSILSLTGLAVVALDSVLSSTFEVTDIFSYDFPCYKRQQ